MTIIVPNRGDERKITAERRRVTITENPLYRSVIGRIFRRLLLLLLPPPAHTFRRIVGASLAIKSEKGEWRKARAVPLGESLDYRGGRNGKRTTRHHRFSSGEGVNENWE